MQNIKCCTQNCNTFGKTLLDICTVNLTFVTFLNSIDNCLFLYIKYFFTKEWTKPGNVIVSEVYKLQLFSQCLKLLLFCIWGFAIQFSILKSIYWNIQMKYGRRFIITENNNCYNNINTAK